MSLINEALKKAQKLRTGDPAGTLPPMPGASSHVTKRGAPRSTQQLLILASGGLALVVVSVVITVWLVNRGPTEKPVAKAAAPKTAAVESGAAPVIVPPVIKPPTIAVETPAAKSNPPPAPTERPATKAAAPIARAPVPAAPTSTPPASPSRGEPLVSAPATPSADSTSTPPPAPAENLPPVKTDERIHVFVDAIKVGGIRSSGDDSRVLMNDRVFRVNDIVERTLGVRLTKVESDALTFTDGNGAIYVKHF